MNGASADDSVNTISSDSRIRNTIIGPSHHFFEVFKKYNSSENNLSRLAMALNPPAVPGPSLPGPVLIIPFFEAKLAQSIFGNLFLNKKIAAH